MGCDLSQRDSQVVEVGGTHPPKIFSEGDILLKFYRGRKMGEKNQEKSRKIAQLSIVTNGSKLMSF